MTKTFIAALMAAGAVAGFASAQDRHDDHGGGGGHGGGAPAAHAEHGGGAPRAGGGAVHAAPAMHAGPAMRAGAAMRGPGAGAARGFSYGGQHHDMIRGPAFSYPQGYGYRRWGIGSILPGLFLSQSYFFGDYATYGFGPPPPGYVWVRYGPDLLLVSRRSGRVRQAVYGVFY